ncbi:MAG: hypothetical protein WDO71_28280 [Bacteroidota bacterium]
MAKYPVDEKILYGSASANSAEGFFMGDGVVVHLISIYAAFGKFKKNKELLLPFLEAVISECPVPAERPKAFIFLIV